MFAKKHFVILGVITALIIGGCTGSANPVEDISGTYVESFMGFNTIIMIRKAGDQFEVIKRDGKKEEKFFVRAATLDEIKTNLTDKWQAKYTFVYVRPGTGYHICKLRSTGKIASMCGTFDQPLIKSN
jgi:hypothetical protein